MGKIIINAVLPTKTKMFCGCNIEAGELCPVCLGHKRSLPVLNKKAVEEAIALVLALNGTITQYTLFDRVKGESGLYDRISQYSFPIGKDGFLQLKEEQGVEKPIGVDVVNTLETEVNEEFIETVEPEDGTRIDIPVFRMKESEEEKGIPVLEIVSGEMSEEQNPYYIEEIEKIFTELGLEEWEIIETDEVIESLENQEPISFLPDPDIPPVIISQWWTDQIAAKYPELIHIEEPEVEEDDDF